jgi:hypothetical protein
MFRTFREYSTAVQRIINDFSHSRRVGIYIHPVTGTQVPDNALCRNVQSNPAQLRITPSLNVVNFQNPLIERQVSIKSHDCVFSSQKTCPFWGIVFDC